MQLSVILCEDHHSTEMARATFTNVVVGEKPSTFEGYKCTVPGCSVCFDNGFGYFRIDENHKIQLSGSSAA